MIHSYVHTSTPHDSLYSGYTQGFPEEFAFAGLLSDSGKKQSQTKQNTRKQNQMSSYLHLGARIHARVRVRRASCAVWLVPAVKPVRVRRAGRAGAQAILGSIPLLTDTARVAVVPGVQCVGQSDVLALHLRCPSAHKGLSRIEKLNIEIMSSEAACSTSQRSLRLCHCASMSLCVFEIKYQHVRLR